MKPDTHVIPIDDLREHREERDCWCQPVVEFGEPDEAAVVIHNSLDGRELVEKYSLQ